MQFVNLTPHAINIDGYGVIPPSGQMARVATTRFQLGYPGGVRIVAQNLGQIDGLPSPVMGVSYIVSGLVLDALKKQAGPAGSSRAGADVFAPDTGADAIRENGHIIAVRGLVC